MISYSPEKLIKNVVIFGLGGTGARVASLICQQLVSEQMTEKVRVVLMDGDVVESKNCRRQLFLQSDVGKNKAEVIAERYRRAFGANVIAVPKFFPTSEDVKDFFIDCSNRNYAESDNREFIGNIDIIHQLLCAMAAPTLEDFETSNLPEDSGYRKGFFADKFYVRLASGLTVFILAVDSIPARLSILEFISGLATLPNIQVSDSRLSFGHYNITSSPPNDQHKLTHPEVTSLVENLLVIDGGNEDVFGQVNYFHPAQVSLAPSEILSFIPERSPYRYKTRVVPMPVGRYLTMKEGESTRRCGDLDQTLAINNLVAANMHLIFQNLFYNNEMTFHMIRFGLNGAYTTEWMSLSWLRSMITTDRGYSYGILSEDAKQKVLGGVSLSTVEQLNQMDSIRYGFTKVPMSQVSSIVPGLFGMLSGPSCRYRQGTYQESLTMWSNGTSLLTDLSLYIKDRVIGEDTPKVETRLPLFTHTTLLDICWSEMVLPILHKHQVVGLSGEGEKGKVLNLLRDKLEVKSIFLNTLGDSQSQVVTHNVIGEASSTNYIISKHAELGNTSEYGEFMEDKGTFNFGCWFMGYTPIRIVSDKYDGIGKITEHKTYEIGTGYRSYNDSLDELTFYSTGVNCLV